MMDKRSILVIGLGCRQGCSVEDLKALIEQSLDQAAIEVGSVCALASIDIKAREPGLIRLATQLNKPFEVFSARQLADYKPRLSHHSSLAFEHTGCWGIAESTALALAEQLSGHPATLLITRQSSPNATFALACAG